MNRHRVRLGLFAAVALLGQTFLAGPIAAQDATPAASPGAGVTVEQIAVVTPGSRTNQGWDQQGADAADQVAERLGIESIVAENAGYEDITPILRDLVASGADLISCHASGYQTVCAEFAAESNVPVAVTELQSAIVPGLVSSIDPLAHEAAYLAGVLAGEVTETGTVGVVVSGEPPTWNYMTVGFSEGLNATNPDAQLLYSVIGEAAYDDAAGAKRVTEQQLAANADVIFGMGDGASFGMIQAIEEHNGQEGATRAWFIDVIGDKTAEHGDVLLSSVLFDYSGVYEQMIEDLAAGTFGKSYVMNVENEGVRLLEPPEEISQEAKDAVAAAQEQIVGGEIEVPAVSDAAEMQARLAELFPQ
jgi:basic membrane protein A